MPAPRYRAPAAGELRVVVLDELVAVYQRAAAQTHLVVSPVPELLELLAGEWLTGEALLERLAQTYDLPDPDASALVARLDELAETGLVERA